MNATNTPSHENNDAPRGASGGWGSNSFLGTLGAGVLSLAATQGPANLAEASLNYSGSNALMVERDPGRVRGLNAVEVRSVEDVIVNWERGHFFTKGNVNMSDAQKNELARHLAENHPNWTVVVMDSARGERYTDFTGRTHRDTVAAESKLFVELPSRTGYADLTDPRRPAVPAGAILLIVMDDRQDGLSFRAEALYDGYGLGEENWLKGRTLINLPRTGMREGLNIRRAVTDTVTGIDSQLGREIELDDLRRNEQRLGAEGNLARLNEVFSRYNERLEDLRSQYPSARGDLLYPDLTPVRNDLELAAESLAQQDFRAANERGLRISNLLNQRIEELNKFESAPEKMEALSGQILSTRGLDPSAARLLAFSEAQRSLNDAQSEWRRGSRAFIQALEESREIINTLPDTVRDYQRAGREIEQLIKTVSEFEGSKHSSRFKDKITEAKKLVSAAELEWKEAAANYHESLRDAKGAISSLSDEVRIYQVGKTAFNTVLSMVSLGIPSILGLGLYFRRRSVKETEGRARSELAELENELGEKAQGLFALSNKQNLWLGTSKEDLRQRYKGQTLESVLSAFDNVVKSYSYFDQLKKIAEEARRCMDGATLRDKFSGEPYERALSILKAREGVQFNPEEDVRFTVGSGEDARVLWASKKDLSAWNLTIDQVRKGLGQAAKSAYESIEQLESVTLEMSSRLGSIQRDLSDFEARVTHLKEQSDRTPLFSYEDLYLEIIRNMKETFHGMNKEAISDPLAVVETGRHLEEASSDLSEIIEIALEIHQSVMPQIKSSKKVIEDCGLKPSALDAELTQHDSVIRDLLRTLAESDATEMSKSPHRVEKVIEALDQIYAFRNLSFEARDIAVSLSKARDEVYPALEKEALAQIEKIAREQNLTEQEVFSQDKETPLTLLKTFNERTLEMISQFESTERDSLTLVFKRVAGLKQLAGEVTARLEQAEHYFQRFDTIVAATLEELEALKEETVTAARVQEKLNSLYAEAALRLGEGDITHPNGDNTVSNNLDEARENIARCEVALSEARNAFRAGNIFTSIELHEKAREALVMTAYRLEELHAKETQLEELRINNARVIEGLLERRDELSSEISDPIVTARTVRRFEQGSKTLQGIQRASKEAPYHPAADKLSLADVSQAFNATQRFIAADFDQHREVGHIISHIETEISRAQREIYAIEREKLPESPGISTAKRHLPQFSSSFSELKNQFEDETRKSNRSSRSADSGARAEMTIWESYEARANILLSGVSSVLSRLKNEKKAGDEALKQLEVASKQVASARNWTGTYGVTIRGVPGRDEMERARTALDKGDYQATKKFALAAASAASDAIRRANDEVANRQRIERERQARIAAERRAAELARLAEMRRRASISSSSSSSRSSGGGFGGFSSGGRSGGFGGFSSGGARGGW